MRGGRGARDDAAVPPAMAKRWLPLQLAALGAAATPGVAAYRHINVSGEDAERIGGECMVSSIVAGSADACLAALTAAPARCSGGGGSSGGCARPSLLGLAEVHVLQAAADGSSQVLLLQLPALTRAGFVGALCAPRAAVVRQTLTRDAGGIYCLLFTSLPQAQAAELLRQHQRCHEQQWRWLPWMGVQQHADGGASHGHGRSSSHHHSGHEHSRRRHSCSSSCASSSSSSCGAALRPGSAELAHTQHRHGSELQHSHSPNHGHHGTRTQQQSGAAAAAAAGMRLLGHWLAGLWTVLGWSSSTPSRCGQCGGHRHTSRGSDSSCSGSRSAGTLGSWLWSPVLLQVAGGYSFSTSLQLQAEGEDEQGAPPTGAERQETLVTCILKADLGGWLADAPVGAAAVGACAASSGSAGSWLCRAAHACGVTEQLQCQLLSGVQLVKQQVEGRIQQQQQQQQQQEHSLGGCCMCAHAANGFAPSGLSASGSSSCSPGAVLVQGLTAGASKLWAVPLAAAQQLYQQLPRLLRASSSQPASRAASMGGAASCLLPPGAAAAGAGTAVAAGGDGAAAAAAVDAVAAKLVGLDSEGRPLSGMCNRAFWSPLHLPGGPALFQVRGASYLSDRRKMPAGAPVYRLIAVDLVTTAAPVHHISRFLPSVQRCRAASCFVVNMMVPTAADVLNLVMTFASSHSWADWDRQCREHSASAGSSSSSASSQGSVSGDGSSADEQAAAGGSDNDAALQRTAFAHALRRFLHAGDAERNSIFKLIPHVEVGSWLLQKSVGTTPVVIGRKLATAYHLTDRYMEVDLDVTTCKTAGFIVQSIRGMTTALVIDLAWLLEGHAPAELPEALIGAVRFSGLDMAATTALDVGEAVPAWPVPWVPLPAQQPRVG